MKIVRQVQAKAKGLKGRFVIKGQKIKKKYDQWFGDTTNNKNITAKIKAESEENQTSDFNWENWIKAMKISSPKNCALFQPAAWNSICVTRA